MVLLQSTATDKETHLVETLDRISFRLPAWERQALRQLAASNDLTESQLVRRGIRMLLRGQSNGSGTHTRARAGRT